MKRLIITAAMIVVVLAVAAQTQATPIVSPGAPLSVNEYLSNPNYGGLGGTGYSTYTGAGAGWQFVQGLTSNFASTNVLGLNGTLESQAWRNIGTGHLTFIYQLENTGTRMLRSGNIYGFETSYGGWRC